MMFHFNILVRNMMWKRNRHCHADHLIYILLFLWMHMVRDSRAQLKDLDVGEYETFFNTGLKPFKKSYMGIHKLQNTIYKSKVEVLGEVLKSRISALRIAPIKEVELIFLVDSSASVGAENFFNELKFVKKLLADFTVSYNYTRVAVVTFSSKSRVVRQIDHLTNASAKNHKCRLLAEELPRISYTGGGTYTIGAVLEAQKILRSARENAAQVVILITDGYSNGGDPRPAAKLLRNNGAEVFTFGIKNGNVRELYDMASEPPQEHSYILDSFEEFEALARRALHEDLHIGSYEEEDSTMCNGLCEEQNDCCDDKAKCTCGTHTGHYACLCKRGFYGTGLHGDCKPCPAGTYLDSNGPADVTACKPCPDMNQNSDPASSSVEDCKCRKGYMKEKLKCVVMECPKLKPPENGYFVKNSCSSVFNAACGIRCNPGYTLVGSSIRLCGENGQWTGEQPSCVIKNCSALKQPKHGKMVCSSKTFSFETHCNFSCEPGFITIGSKMRTCLAIASWDGLPSFCRPVTCPPLQTLEHGSVIPTKCTRYKSRYGDSCSYSCEQGFTLLGPIKRQCGEQGAWSSSLKKATCVDTSPPELVCPPDIEVETDVDDDVATVTWNLPNVKDNLDDDLTILTIPIVKLPMRFPIGLTRITYAAEDHSRNRAECNFTVTVRDVQPPTVDSCISPPVFLSKDKSIEVVWDEPIFSDNSGNPVHVNSSHVPGPFPFGETAVSYIAWDDAGNNSTCVITIAVQEHACAVPMDPLNGHVNCSELEDGFTCSLTCEEGYAFAFRPPSSFFCMFDGTWSPVRDTFPDCSLTALPKDALQKSVITLQSEDAPCEDSFFMHQVENKFQRKLSNKIEEYCANGIDCDVTYVSAACEEYLSKVEEESNYILRRRKRSVAAHLKESAIISSIESLHSSQPFMHNVTRQKSFTTKLKKVALQFELAGSLKAQNKTIADSSVLHSAMDTTLHHLKQGAQRGELDLQLGQIYLTYSGLRLLNDQPIFICELGSILLDDYCVQCPVGTFFNVVTEQCQACGRGSYQFAEGQLSCLVCPGNTSTSHSHSKSLSECKAQCLPGTFSSDGLEMCETCSKSFYQPGYSRTSCIQCPGSNTTRRRGARKEEECKELCPKGHVSETGLVPCYACPIGYYQPKRGQQVCYRCRNASPTLHIGSFHESHCLEVSSTNVSSIKSTVEELMVNDCFSIPCLNGGSCRILSFGYVCDCSLGYTGTHCETEINECNSSPCHNGGTCIDEFIGYQCICPSGYEGVNCEVDVDECTSSPCLNGGTCIDYHTYFQCKCPLGYQGKMCQTNINECISEPCQNGGTCIDQVGTYFCDCPLGFVGSECETEVDECESGPCLNGGTCVDRKGEFRCECIQGFSGALCNINIDECTSNPCMHGGTCLDQINGFKCHCVPSYAGKFCENELSYDFIMHFPISGIMDYAQGEGFHRDLSQLSACLWLKTNDNFNYGTPISYANTSLDNIFTLTDYNGFVLYVNGEKVITDVTTSDGEWHFICASWTNAGGIWKIYKDGILNDEGQNLASGTLIPGDGTLVLGQDQDSLLGGFSSAESFIGSIGWVNFWDYVLAPQDVFKLSSTCDKYLGSIRAWPDFLPGVKGRVKLEESLFCKGCSPHSYFKNGRVTVSGKNMHSILTYKCNKGFALRGVGSRKCMIHGGWEGEEPRCESLSCGFPGYLQNGRISGGGFLYLEVITYVCNAGYRLVGNDSRVCQADGQWDGTPPVCVEILCPPPVPPENGEILSGLSRFQLSMQVKYSCKTGYRLDGVAVITCSHDGVWDEEPPTCQPVLCSELPYLQNGQVIRNLSSTPRVGDKIILTCHEGFQLIGNQTLTCSEQSQWQGEMPRCSPVDCGQPLSITNANYIVHDTTFRSTVNYTCKDGFSSNGFSSVSLTCGALGIWEGKGLACDPVPCPSLLSIRYGDFKMSAAVFNNTVVYSCMEGYKLKGDSLRTCQANGTWSGRAPSCSRIHCDDPDIPLDGSYEETGPWVAGTTVTYSCNVGYRREGPSQRTCLDSGQWSQHQPQCILVECPNPEMISNGYYVEKTFFFLSTVQYHCDEGYRPVGNVTRECMGNGSWSGHAPTCEKVSCGSVDNIQHGKVELGSFVYSSIVMYSCDKGFKLQGPHTRVCLANGSWSDYQPSCIRAHCTSPKPLSHGHFTVTGTEQGAVIDYTCDPGYILEGPTQQKCETNGHALHWSHRPPHCLPVNCTVPDQITNGFVQTSSLQYGSVAEYVCNYRYELVGPSLRICMDDGSWSDTAPTCVLGECPEPPTVAHVKAVGSNYAIGAIIQYECDLGYVIIGPHNITCTEDKKWTPLPQCFPTTCSWPLALPLHGIVVSTGHEFGDVVHYECDEGYELQGVQRRSCLPDGTWSDTEPICEPVHCSPLQNISNGRVNLDKNVFLSLVWYECDPQYVLVGMPSRRCLASKEWSGEPPRCERLSCTPPESIPNGLYIISDPTFALGTVVHYRCERGYNLLNNGTLQCVSPGYWEGNLPECQAVMCQLPMNLEYYNGKMVVMDINNSAVPAATSGSVGSVVHFNCDRGFNLVGESRVTCTIDGSWDAPFPVCVDTSCPPPPLLPNGKISAKEFTVGAKVIYSCNTGYKLIGTTNHTCTSDNTWTSSVNPPRCEVVHCPEVSSIPNGTFTMTNGNVDGSPYAYGTSVTFECNPGFFLNGKTMMMCDATGRWSSDYPSCIRVKCSKTKDVPHGDYKIILPKSESNPSSKDEQQADYDFYPLETRLLFACHEGYLFNSEATERFCDADGHWSGNEPHCVPISCGRPPDLLHGTAIYNSTTYGGNAEYFCDDGYFLDGALQRTCLSNGSWSDEELKCTAIRCPSLGHLQHGRYHLQGDGSFGTMVNVECDLEFTVVGTTTRTCRRNGTWSGTEPACVHIECPVPESILHGAFDLDGTVVGSVSRYICDQGFELIGESVLTCMLDGTWSSEAPPTCMPIECPELSHLPYGSVTSDGRHSGTVARYSCNPGYELLDGDQERTCLENRTWSGKQPSCQEIVCEALEGIANGQIFSPALNLHSMALYVCDEGYVLHGRNTRMCQENHQWDGNAPLCSILTCPTIDSLPNGRIHVSGPRPYVYNSTIHFDCLPMFSLHGSPRMHCLANGSWSSNVPNCIRSHCEKPSSVPDATVNWTSTAIGTTIQYVCREGFDLVGESEHRCLENGSWTGVVPKCVPILCGPPPEVNHTVVQLAIPREQDPYSYGSTASYACDDGFELRGSPALVCEANGKWLGSVPSCKKLACESPPLVAHSLVQVENYEHLSRAVYFCDHGYALASADGTSVVHCLPSGVWDMHEDGLKCIPVVCPKPPPAANARVVPRNYSYGSVANYSCNLGYHMVPSPSRNPLTCSAKGTWKGVVPRCHPITCQLPEVPANSLLENDDDEFKFGAVVNYTCKTGYRLVGNDTRICQEDGRWSGGVPQCHRIQCEEPEPPQNGYVMVDDRKLGDVARFTCEEGYHLEGPTQVICEEDGKWAKTIPVCKALKCQFPTLPIQAIEAILKEEYFIGDQIELRCLPGHYPTSNMTLQCLSNGTWSLPIGQCERVSCGSPPTSAGVIIMGSSYLYHDTLTYSCPKGLNPKGRNIISCQADGTWDAVPACEALCPRSCLNGGICIGPAKCKCRAGFVGDICQHAFCPIPCLNGGTCIKFNVCSCLPSYSGSRCQTPICKPACPSGQKCKAPNVCG